MNIHHARHHQGYVNNLSVFWFLVDWEAVKNNYNEALSKL